MLDRRQVLPREALVDEQPHLLDVLVAQLLAQGLPHGMGAGLGHRSEDETVAGGKQSRLGIHGKAPRLPGEAGRQVYSQQPCQNL